MKNVERAFLFFFVFISLFANIARAASVQTVAVMPFRDLSGAKASIGEAIRETVTTDLKEISGLKVIERGSLDKVLAEQKLQGTTDFDVQTSARLGKLLGATLIVTGAYQKASPTVRLTARFVKVETGEIVGTAKVDGSSSDFLSLQDKVTAELLKSAGIEKKAVAKVASRPRPKVKSLRAVEIYGDAVVEVDESKRRELLKAALKEDPQFTYALHDLEELEKRMKAYSSIDRLEHQRATAEFKRRLEQEKNPAMLMAHYGQYIGSLSTERRWRRVAAESRAIVENAPPDTQAGGLRAFAHYQLIQAYEMLKDDDAVLREGERFLVLYPGTSYFQGVRSKMDSTIDKKRNFETNKKKAADEISTLSPAERNDPCKVGTIYNSNEQWRDALPTWEKCLKAGGGVFGTAQVHQFLAISAFHAGDFPRAIQEIQGLEKLDTKLYRSTQPLLQVIPVD